MSVRGIDHNGPIFDTATNVPIEFGVKTRRNQAAVNNRDVVLAAAHAARPERFVRGVPHAPQLPTAVWINKPAADQSDQSQDQPDQSDQIAISSLN